MNIVLFVNSYLPQIGGRELVVHYLAQALQRLGHDVRVVGPGGRLHAKKNDFGYPLHRFAMGPKGPVREAVLFAQLWWDLRRNGCDILHAHTTYPNGYVATRLSEINKVPVVITAHGADIHVIPGIGHGRRLDPVVRPKIERALQRCRLLTAISASVEASYLDAGAPAGKIRRIPNGVDLPRFEASAQADLRAWLGLPADARLIVTVGNFHPRKGHDVLVRAMPRVLAAEPRARLVIVGRTEREPDSLAALIDSLGLHAAVKRTGPVAFPDPTATGADAPPDRLAGIYAASELYVSAGIDEAAEGLSLALLEAMAARLPVVATAISGNRDIVTDGVNGELVRPSDPDDLADHLIALLADDARRKTMSAAAYEVASRYQWTEIARQYVAVYEEALARRGAGS